MSTPDDDAASTTLAEIVVPTAEERVRQRLAREAAAEQAAKIERETKRRQAAKDFPAQLEKSLAVINAQIRMTHFYLDSRDWPGDCHILEVVTGYTLVTYRRWFKTYAYYEQHTQSLAACPLVASDISRLYLGSDDKIYQSTFSSYFSEDGLRLKGYHDINSSDVVRHEAYWPSADNVFAYTFLEQKTAAIVRLLKDVRHEKLL